MNPLNISLAEQQDFSPTAASVQQKMKGNI